MKDFTINNMKKLGLKGSLIFFSADLNPIDTKDILDIHRYLMKGTCHLTSSTSIKQVLPLL